MENLDSHYTVQIDDLRSGKPPPQRLPHIKFGSLPKPDHQTGTVIQTKELQLPTLGKIAQRRIEKIDHSRELADLRWSQHGRSKHFERRKNPSFSNVRWAEEPHPGTRIPLSRLNDYSVSPETFACTDSNSILSRTARSEQSVQASEQQIWPPTPMPQPLKRIKHSVLGALRRRVSRKS